MIINDVKHGQLGNRLFYLAHLIACSIETGHTIIDYSLDEYGMYFKGTYKQSVFSYPKQYKFLSHYMFRKISLAILTFLKKKLGKSSKFILNHNQKEYQTSAQTYFNTLKKSKILISNTWVDTEFLNLGKYKAEIKVVFEPKEEHLKQVKYIIGTARRSCEILVGVHIRRGDYREYMNGRYFFDDESYCTLMKAIEGVFATKKITFFLCSNEEINKENFAAFNILTGNKHVIEDLYCLAKCDYITGPPSTYSAWASFYGDVPLFSVKELNRNIVEINIDNFIICNDRLSWLYNGN